MLFLPFSPSSPVPITPYPQRGPRVPQSPLPLIPRGGPEFPNPQSPVPNPPYSGITGLIGLKGAVKT
ncbi:hypothetical protein FDUTEX481_07527 [Tolypothrix sp. PCC 7601]|nr:hypothetical protein FDUTEX481_07527 [Tolypothrix sp. PCC 7601]